MSAPNVLRVNCVEEQTAERDAVAQILIDIQASEKVTLLEIAERIDVSLGTISNAANKKTDLCRTYLKRLGLMFGGHYLDPFHALYGVRGVPLLPANVKDILPLIARANLRIAEARDPESPGGVREIHTERLGYLPDLKLLQRELSSLIIEIEGLAA